MSNSIRLHAGMMLVVRGLGRPGGLGGAAAPAKQHVQGERGCYPAETGVQQNCSVIDQNDPTKILPLPKVQ